MRKRQRKIHGRLRYAYIVGQSKRSGNWDQVELFINILQHSKLSFL